MAPSLLPLRILLVSTAVGPIGSGSGGGVELTIANIALELGRRGHEVTVIAPRGSRLPHAAVVEVDGEAQSYAQYQGREAPVILQANSVLAAMWDSARTLQQHSDLIVNFGYDWLPLYLTAFFRIPVLHVLSMSSLSDAMDGIVSDVARRFPQRVAAHTRAQAQTFPGGDAFPVLLNGLDLRLYPFHPQAEPRLCWVGRIAPEKGLEDAVAVALATGMPLDVCGILQDTAYWLAIRAEYPQAQIHYQGFLPTAELAAIIGRSHALLITPKWTEALGNVAIEALACGTPVIAYRRGGLPEIVEHGVSGILVDPDDIAALVAAVEQVKAIDRGQCRVRAEESFSLSALGDRLEAWFRQVLSDERAMSTALQQ